MQLHLLVNPAITTWILPPREDRYDVFIAIAYHLRIYWVLEFPIVKELSIVPRVLEQGDISAIYKAYSA